MENFVIYTKSYGPDVEVTKRFKESGGDVLSEMLDFLSEKEVPRSIGAAGDSKDDNEKK